VKDSHRMRENIPRKYKELLKPNNKKAVGDLAQL
jgi:hypothetical protein